MDRPLPQTHQSVQEVIQEWPQTVNAFQALKTACVGCMLARFCTLQEVAATYQIPTEALMEQLRGTVTTLNSYNRSEQ